VFVAGFSADYATTKLWDHDAFRFEDTVSGGLVLTDIKLPESFFSVEISNGRKFVMASDGKNIVRIWDLTSRKTYDHKLAIGEYVSDYQLSPDGRLLVDGGYEAARFWDVHTGREVLKIDSLGVVDTAFTRDGRFFTTTTRRASVPGGPVSDVLQIWDARTLKPVGPPITDTESWAVEDLAAERVLAITTVTQGVRFFDAITHREIGQPTEVYNRLGLKPGWRATTMYAIDRDHRLYRFAIDSRLTADASGLVAAACRDLGKAGALRLTPAEVKASGLMVALDPCAAPTI
jgi:WD40 repeat protein